MKFNQEGVHVPSPPPAPDRDLPLTETSIPSMHTRGGSRIPGKRGRQHTNLPDFPQKLHEIKKTLVRGGGGLGGGA